MLTAQPPPSRVTSYLQGEDRDNPIGLKNFLRTLAKDTARLTYRQSKQAKSLSAPNEETETSKHEARGTFLPLLPLPDPDIPLDTRDDCPLVANDAVELQVSKPPARRRSISPKVLKVYGKAQGPPPLRNAKPGRDGDDHALNEANPMSCEKQDNRITRSQARKRKKGAEPVPAEDGALMMDRSLSRKRKRPRQLQVSGLALARTISSPIVYSNDSEVRSTSTACVQ